MVSVFSLVRASEAINQQIIPVTVFFGATTEGKNYIVSDIRRNCILNTEPNNSYYAFPSTLKKEEITEIKIFNVDAHEKSIAARGYNQGAYIMEFKGSGYNNLKKDLEGIKARSSQYSGSFILVSLWNEAEKKGIGLEFTTTQLGLNKQENNRTRSIIVFVGIAALALYLTYYFDLYPKDMTAKGAALLEKVIAPGQKYIPSR
jgi:hypothetical protein